MSAPTITPAAPAAPPTPAAPRPARLRLGDLLRVSSVGLRTRRLRAALSALGIAIGVASIVAVLGLSASSQAGLLAEIDRLGTNLLTVTNGQTFSGDEAKLPTTAAAMIGRVGPVTAVQQTGAVDGAVYRSPYIPAGATNGLSVLATSTDLPSITSAPVVEGRFLNEATAKLPVAVLGSAAAERLGIDKVFPGARIWISGKWFYVVGILGKSALAPELDTTILVGFPAAETYLDFDGHPTMIYVRSHTDQVEAVQGVLAQTANPEHSEEVKVSRPSATLEARAAAKGTLDGLFIGLGAVALLVGAVGVANIMIISVLERRSEIGLRRALGARRGQVRVQFLSEAILLTMIGGAVGVAAGATATAYYASSKDWDIVVPTVAWAGGIASAVVIGAIAGLLPAVRAARMSPTESLRSV